MQAANIIKTGLKIAVVTLTIAAALGVSNTTVLAASPDLLTGITLDSSLSVADVAYLQTSLQFLHDRLPDWAQYIEEAKPFSLTVNVDEGAHGHAAIAKCCDPQGHGSIKFGFHFGQSPDDAGETPEARQVAFLGTLVHEVTHIRDQRAGRFTTKTDRKSCVAAEKSGLEKQLEVKRTMAAENLGDAFAQELGQQIADEAGALKSRELWDMYCGAFEN